MYSYKVIYDFLLTKRDTNNANWDWLKARIHLWERNSKDIQIKLGGKKAGENKEFVKELNTFKELWSRSHREKEAIIKSQLGEATQFDKLLNAKGMRITDVIKVAGTRK